MTCYNQGQYGYSAFTYKKQYQSKSLTALNLLYFNADTGVSVAYDCIDKRKALQVIEYLERSFGFSLPRAVINNFMNLLSAGHYDAFFILGNTTSITKAEQTAITQTLDNYFTRWSFSSMKAFDMTGC